MIRKFTIVLAIGAGFALAFLVGLPDGTADRKIPEAADMKSAGISGPLDGMEFGGELGPEGKTKDVPDVFVFEDGTFVSRECELRCDYPASPYFVSESQDKIEFVSLTKCPYKDADITWQGTVVDNRISGTATWTIRRWYWTVTRVFEFQGVLRDENDGAIALH